MKDYVRACMSSICFFTRQCSNYAQLYVNLNYLTKAREHLDSYLEISSKQANNNSNTTMQQQQQIKGSKNEQHNLCKQMSTQDVDK